MTIVITTPTGNIGGKTASLLLDAKENITVIARNRDKVAALAKRGAKIVEGSHSDSKLLVEATRNAKALLFITPPNFVSEDIVADYAVFGEAAAEAISQNNIPHVVYLSSVGAEQTSGTGPILGSHYNEERLNKVARNIVHLRPAYFMENTLGQIQSIIGAGQLFTPLKGNTAFPMIATADIAARAAMLLKTRNFSGQQVMELMGPEDMSYNRVAEVLSGVLGKKLSHTTVPGSALVDSIVQMGGSKHMGESLLELTMSIESNHIHFSQERSEENRTSTTYETFAKEIFMPVFEHQAA